MQKIVKDSIKAAPIQTPLLRVNNIGGKIPDVKVSNDSLSFKFPIINSSDFIAHNSNILADVVFLENGKLKVLVRQKRFFEKNSNIAAHDGYEQLESYSHVNFTTHIYYIIRMQYENITGKKLPKEYVLIDIDLLNLSMNTINLDGNEALRKFLSDNNIDFTD